MTSNISESFSVQDSMVGKDGNSSPAVSVKMNDLGRAKKWLARATQAWFSIAILGQFIFVYYVAVFYGGNALEGNLEAWNKVLPHGYIPGDTIGNIAVAMHLFLAIVIIVGGALQFIPWIRKNFPVFHRWNGRVYVITAIVLSIGGIHMVVTRGVVGDGSVSITINALLIMLCAGMAWRDAMVRKFKTHRQWAIRLFLVVSGVWFFRIGLMFWLMLNQGPVGFDPKTFTGPFLTFLQYAQYLLPLFIAEIYFRVEASRSAKGHLIMSASMWVFALATGFGIFAATMGMWIPRL